ncbi:hypothetical protein RhiirA4_448942 [Rhizophagus irregularis]|uniref:Uncharacterized protein n=1 Tax=Rhizophagus irregularis TaxID=588596 RepID=A0A2I1HEB6_9GLOM|nr:hypothetical protein RhiirA4_448942 [Rhizophagus irregularis]
MKETFTQSGTSLRLVMFQVSFLKMVKGKEDDMDRRYGYSSNEMNISFIKKIYAAKTWNVFFDMIDSPLPEKNCESEVCDMLIYAVKDSEISGYHQNPYTNNELFHLRRKHEAKIPAPSSWLNNENETAKIDKYGVMQFLTFRPGNKNKGGNDNKSSSFSEFRKDNNIKNININNNNRGSYRDGGLGRLGRRGRRGGRGGGIK